MPDALDSQSRAAPLAAAEPRLEWIATGNAATNKHMIAVNEQLGYKVAEPGWRIYEIPVASIR